MPDDDTIGRIIQRDLDQLPMLPAERWVPRDATMLERTPFGRTSTIALARATSVGVAIVLVAAAAGLGLANWRAQRTAVDESPTAAIGVPGPLALAGGAPSLGFGLVSTEVNTLLVRNETTVSAPFRISNAWPQVTISPNGHEIAYWRTVPDRTGGAMWELFRSDLIDPAARDVGVMAAPAGEVPGSFVWSSDGTGLVVNTHSAAQRGPVVGGQSSAAHSTWFTVDVASRKATELALAFESAVSTVYAWDRQRDLITGSGVTAPDQNAFITLQSGRVATHALPAGTVIAAADTYGRSVVLASLENCKGISSATRCPMLETRDQATFKAFGVWESLNEPAHDVPQVVFRPRSQDLIVQFSLPNGDARVELWSDLGRVAHQVLATYTQTARFMGSRELVLPRVDGSAVFLMKFDDSAGGRWFGEIVSLSPTYNTAGGQPQRTPFEIRAGGNPLASVVLDPAFARALATPRQTSPSPSPVQPSVVAGPDDAIRAVQHSPAASMFASFPTTAGSKACDIRGGGPAPGLLVPGTCRTDVQASGSGYVVTFTIVWDASQFHRESDPGYGPLQHSWPFAIDATGAVAPGSDSGNFPPQYVR